MTANPAAFWDRFRSAPVQAAPRPPGLAGVAMVFNTVVTPTFEYPVDEPRGRYLRTRTLSGAYDKTLAGLDTGRRVVELRVDHDLSPAGLLCTTRDALDVWKRGGRLLFDVRLDFKAGRRAHRFAKRNRTYRGASVGCRPRLVFSTPDDPQMLIVCTSRLREISLVINPGCPGARVYVD
jgi:hypothetical protein